ncbi:ATP-binding protein [Candidatus Falkowbacteria bacterium]|nr:MAG: ATP-binding protein [Candidatus Falkowbacteria bacterium]
MNNDLIQYIQQQIRTTSERIRRYTHSPRGEKYPQRFMFVKIKQYIDGFLNKTQDNRMVIIPGFRGVGKTTLMAQICEAYSKRIENILFLSVEETYSLLNAGINDIVSAFESVVGQSVDTIEKPTLIFLDEIQTDPKWAVSLKILFDKTSNVFFCCTGSSAVILQTTTNLARRALFERMPPMSFIEYEMIKNQTFPSIDLKNKIRQAIYFSNSAEEVFNSLNDLQGEINTSWSKINRYDIKTYLSYGTLPFSLTMPNETAVYDAISLLLDKIIKQDLPTLGSFDPDTLGAVKRILFAIAENDTTSLGILEERFKINRLTISNIFEALEKAELLIKVPAYGSNMTVARKPNKYLFMSPAIRMTFFYYTGQESTYLTRQGKLLEDSFASHLYREFILRNQGLVRYDSAQGGADFILQIMNNKQIVIEVGMGSKDVKQIATTAKKINSDYNLIFSNSELKINPELKTVFIPLDYYFLM